MDVSTIVIVVAGLIFFGGLGYLGWREQGKARPPDTTEASRVHPDASKKEEAGRRKRPTH